MSHFAVLVVGPNIEEQLAPYHEFESTGTNDQYVVDEDDTEEARKAYAKNTSRRFKDPEGVLHDPYTAEGDARDQFYREPTPEEEKNHKERFLSTNDDGLRWVDQDWHDGRGYRGKIFQLPPGWEEVEVPTSTVETFAEFIEGYYGHPTVRLGEELDLEDKHKYGYILVDENGEVVKSVNRTNPNRKWDWWSVGGRWNGFFKMKKYTLGALGKPGIQTMNEDYTPPSEDRADVALKGDIDVEGMRNEAAKEAGETYDAVQEIIGQLPRHLTWEQVKANHATGGIDEDGEPQIDYNASREFYNAQPAVKAMRNSKDYWHSEPDRFLCTREQYIERARAGAFSTFAVVKNGVWYERGSMGWWGMVSNEKDSDEWHLQFAALIDGLPDETVLSVVDCHI
jgi:hypothetical protein